MYNMEKKKVLSLDEKDIKISSLLTDLGISKSTAKTLIFLLQSNKECSSSEIESGSRLRQPEVSIAMQTLRAKNWATKRDEKKEGKGRPVHYYKLTITKKNIVEELEKEKLKEIEKIKEDLEKIKSFISSS